MNKQVKRLLKVLELHKIASKKWYDMMNHLIHLIVTTTFL